MGLVFGFHRTLFRLGGWRFGVGYHAHGSTAIFLLCLFGFLNLLWYMFLGCLWVMYGFVWLFIILPIRGIVRLIRRRRGEIIHNDNV